MNVKTKKSKIKPKKTAKGTKTTKKKPITDFADASLDFVQKGRGHTYPEWASAFDYVPRKGV